MAAKRITQETFDSVVQENIIEFGMDPEEAVFEAVQQFESQGVDLSNIVKVAPNPIPENGQEQKHAILQTLDSLQKAVVDSDSSKVDEFLAGFTEQCRQELAVRYLAGQKGAYPAVLAACRLASEDRCSLLKALSALSTLMDGQPDLLDAAGQELLLRVLRESRDDAELTLAAVRGIRHACLKHEQNRQDLVKGGVLQLLAGAIVRHGDCADVVREACSGLRIMTFDDDIRVPFGHAHDHAKMIVVEHDGLRILIEAAKVFTDDCSVLGEICATLARLSVRNEFCQEIVDLGGLNFMVALLADCIDHQVPLSMSTRDANAQVGPRGLQALQLISGQQRSVSLEKMAALAGGLHRRRFDSYRPLFSTPVVLNLSVRTPSSFAGRGGGAIHTTALQGR